MDRPSLLASIPMFESLPPEDLAGLAAQLEEVELPDATVVFNQGDEGTMMYIIVEGAVEIAIEQGNRRKIVVATLFPGQYFGELSLLDGGLRSATARTVKPSVALTLTRADFAEFVTTRPQAALRILAEMGERMRQTNELMSRQVSKNVVEEVEEKLTFGQRIADKVATFGGSWGFIFAFGGAMGIWMLVQVAHTVAWDPYPFILLNLCLSTVAALQAPVIMMSQNRQASKDKLLAQNDFQVNLKNELGIESLIRGQAELMQRMAMLERAQILGRPPGSATPAPLDVR
jgi:CRP/FNR family transcriptional regulator, cyclic AMP receptor protein